MKFDFRLPTFCSAAAVAIALVLLWLTGLGNLSLAQAQQATTI